MPEGKVLSEREEQILQLVATGMTNREIAQQLTISPNTVKVHLSNVFEKIGVASRTEATLYAIEHGVVNVPGSESPAEDKTPEAESIWKKFLPVGAVVAVVVILLGSYLIFGTDLVLPRATPTPEQIQALVETEERWTELAPLPEPRAGLAATAYDGDIYAIAGEGPQGVSDSVFRYVVEENSWEVLLDKPTPVRDVKAVLIGEKIYVPGGMRADGMPTDILEIYDPREDRWQKGAALPQAISSYALADFEGQMYLFGGWDGERALDNVYIYDPDEDAWREGTPMPTARYDAGAGVVQDKIYIIGGFDIGDVVGENEVYSPSREASNADVWDSKEPLNQDVQSLGVESLGDLLFVIVTNKEGRIEVLQYSSQQNTWLLSSEGISVQSSHSLETASSTGYLFIIGMESSGEELVGITYKYQAIFTYVLPNIEY